MRFFYLSRRLAPLTSSLVTLLFVFFGLRFPPLPVSAYEISIVSSVGSTESPCFTVSMKPWTSPSAWCVWHPIMRPWHALLSLSGPLPYPLRSYHRPRLALAYLAWRLIVLAQKRSIVYPWVPITFSLCLWTCLVDFVMRSIRSRAIGTACGYATGESSSSMSSPSYFRLPAPSSLYSSRRSLFMRTSYWSATRRSSMRYAFSIVSTSSSPLV